MRRFSLVIFLAMVSASCGVAELKRLPCKDADDLQCPTGFWCASPYENQSGMCRDEKVEAAPKLSFVAVGVAESPKEKTVTLSSSKTLNIFLRVKNLSTADADSAKVTITAENCTGLNNQKVTLYDIAPGATEEGKMSLIRASSGCAATSEAVVDIAISGKHFVDSFTVTVAN